MEFDNQIQIEQRGNMCFGFWRKSHKYSRYDSSTIRPEVLVAVGGGKFGFTAKMAREEALRNSKVFIRRCKKECKHCPEGIRFID